ncbi:DNA-binding transcriptional LysR family regulator [Streptomyces achromogenes]|uniref:LysR family transcriptional regulator n=1 Tax=Streptomyces achromogenes TaxID=67255 RepID=UPI002784A780|nr:LysR family transcriptional regulator [Streptomyces achromogenes]MDQ0832905.1 DNA-binding transcriptional LysR family regulator [Streptomyces achromogenes]
MIEARHLRVLRAVAATGSFSAAGRELGCTQPAVSQQMKALEASVGTPLLIRSGREMRLTQAGEALVRHAAGILSGLTAAEEEVAAIAGLRAGRVRLVSFPSGSSTLVPTALAALRAAHPGTRVSLEEAEPPQSVRLLREGDCDIALAFRYERAAPGGAHRRGSGPLGFDRVGSGQVRPGGLGPGDSGDDEWADLVVRPLLKDRLVALVPERHRLARTGSSDTVAIGDLAAEPWIAGCPRCRGQLVQVCESAGFTPRIDFATDDYPAVVGLVGAGLGVAVLPQLAIDSVRPRGVRALTLEPAVRREIVALTLPDLAHVPAVTATLEQLGRAAAPS